MAPQNILRGIVLALDNKLVLYCIVMISASMPIVAKPALFTVLEASIM